MGDEQSSTSPAPTLSEAAEVLSNQISQLLHSHQNNSITETNQTVSISIKLNDHNYGIWSRMVELAIGGRGRLEYLTGIPEPPSITNPNYQKWRQIDLQIFSMIIQSMEPKLQVQYIQYPTTKELWAGLQATYRSGEDSLQIFDLMCKANQQRQGTRSLEQYYQELQCVWIEIDRRLPNPMKCYEDLQIFNKMRQQERLYQFLWGLDEKFALSKRDILKEHPLPSIEIAYGTVRREAAQLNILSSTSLDNSDTVGIGIGMAARGRSDLAGFPAGSSTRSKIKTDKKCTHCGVKGHVKEECFHLIGYPDWWEPRPRKGDKAGAGNNGATKGAFVAAVVSTQMDSSTMRDTGGAMKDTGNRDIRSRGRAKTGAMVTGFEAAAASFHGGDNDGPKEGIGFEGGISSSNPLKTNPKYFSPQVQSLWMFDCGSTDTVTNDIRDLSSRSIPHKTHVQTANGALAPVEGAGAISITPELNLRNCLYVPSLSCKLLSISHVTKELNCTLLMYPSFCVLQDIQTKEIIGRGSERGGLYFVDDVVQTGNAMLSYGSTDQKSWLWHRRLGHPSNGYLNRLFPQFSDSHINCDICVLAKSRRHSYLSNNTKVTKPFSLIHSDVWGPAPTRGGHGFRYFLTFIDDCTRVTWVYFLKEKSEVPNKFISFFTMIQTQFTSKIQILRSDNGGEFVNHTLRSFFQQNGLIHQTTCPNTPQQNGVAERKNRTLLEITRSLMLESRVPSSYWPEAVSTATYLTNRLPTKILDYQTPLKTLSTHTSIPPAFNLTPRIFGCSVFVHIPKKDRNKFDPCAHKCVFVGYGINQKGYRCYDPQSHRMYITMDCDFLETEYFFSQQSVQGENLHTHTESLSWLHSPMSSDLLPERQSGMSNKQSSSPNDKGKSTELADTDHPSSGIPEVSGEFISNTSARNNDDDVVAVPEEEEIPKYVLPARSTRGIPPRRYRTDYETGTSRYPVANLVRGSLTSIAHAFHNNLYSEEIPRTVEEAQQKKEWSEAMDIEMEALEKNGTWEKYDLPKGKKVVGCRWVFTIKHKADGTIERYKARLVAKGYTQTYGIDYSETFSPVAKIDTIRVLFSIAANQDWPLYQFDVKNAFLHGDLKEEVYMEAPPGFREDFRKGQVCRLKKALYGLKQSPRAWFGRFTMAMKHYGYKQSNSDHTLFLKRKDGKTTCLIIYVDDMVITGDDDEEMALLRENLFKEFEMKDLGGLKYFLGIEVMRSEKGIYISQRKYILDLLAETGMVDCKPVDTPIILNHGLTITEGAPMTNQGRYQRLVGKLIYLSHTRPDIAYAVGVVSQFMHKPQEEHMEAVVRIIRYLKGTPGRGVLFRKNGHLDIKGYTDADWAGNKLDRKSTSGYFTIVGGNLVTWKSKKQKVVALSSAEAEFRGITRGLTEILWLRKLMTELGFPPSGSCKLLCDNKAAISISENPVQHDRTKHVEVDRHFIKEKLEANIISLPHVRSEDQLADILTKSVTGKFFHEVLGKLDVRDPTVQLEGEC